METKNKVLAAHKHSHLHRAERREKRKVRVLLLLEDLPFERNRRLDRCRRYRNLSILRH